MAALPIAARADTHRDALLKLWRDSFDSARLAQVAGERFEWLYRETPAGSTRTCVAVDPSDDDVIGCASVFPSTRYIAGSPITIGVAVDFAVDRHHRTAGVALALQGAILGEAHRAGFACVLAKPNRKALPIFKRVGYRPIGEAQDWVKHIGHDTGAADAVGLPSEVGAILDAADERFDRLWGAGRCRYRNVGEKSAAFLNWRYTDFPEQHYRFYCVFDDGDRRLLGYLCFSADETTVFVADAFMEDPDSAIVDRLLLGLAAAAGRQGYEWIGLSCLGAHPFEHRLERLGFIHGRHRRMLLAFVPPHVPDALRADLFDGERWFILAGEMDLF